MAVRSLRAVLLLCSIGVPAAGLAGETSAPPAVYPAGISMAYGAGRLGLRDENISTRRYAGTLPYIMLAWAADHSRYIYGASLELQQSDRIRSDNVNTDVTRFNLGQVFLYPLRPRRFLGHNVQLLVGPRTELDFYLNQQHIAVDALGFAESVCLLTSLSAQAEALMPLTARLALPRLAAQHAAVSGHPCRRR
ncbi:MAG: hypothetical protein O2782_12450 [bacterium]|nr:hypothetical protein [bacterium]